jgi:hypothetical protein
MVERLHDTQEVNGSSPLARNNLGGLMHLILHTVKWICDFCDFEEIVQTTQESAWPDGWGNKDVGGFGSTGYTRHMDCCPTCNKKTLKQDDNRYWLE